MRHTWYQNDEAAPLPVMVMGGGELSVIFSPRICIDQRDLLLPSAPVRCFGTHCPETCVTRHILLIFLDDHLKHFFSQSTSVHSASEAFATMRYIN